MKTRTAAIYLRLSDSEGCDGESSSIANQRKIILDHIKSNDDLSNYSILEFCDDGFTGTDFDRPAFKELISKTQQGSIDCVLVKDFSRLGRNLTLAGFYVERFFCSFGVRFISVCESFDSTNSKNGIGISLSFMISELYSRDLSIKVKSSKRLKMEKGSFTGGKPLYGFKVDSGRLIEDVEKAAVVRRIFELFNCGHSFTQIARHLNESGCSPPSNRNPDAATEGFWSRYSISRIIRDERYTGTHIAARTFSTAPYKRAPRKPNEVIRIEDDHCAIVDKEKFLCAKSRLKSAASTKKDKSGEEYSILCANCGCSLRKKQCKNDYLYCETKRVTSKFGCCVTKFDFLKFKAAVNSAHECFKMIYDEHAFKEKIILQKVIAYDLWIRKQTDVDEFKAAMGFYNEKLDAASCNKSQLKLCKVLVYDNRHIELVFEEQFSTAQRNQALWDL